MENARRRQRGCAGSGFSGSILEDVGHPDPVVDVALFRLARVEVVVETVVHRRQHRAIVDAIRARDAEAAGRLMKEHLESARRSLVEAAS